MKSAAAEVSPVLDRSDEVETLQKKVDNLNRLLEGKVNEVVDVQKQLNVRAMIISAIFFLFVRFFYNWSLKFYYFGGKSCFEE